MKQILITDDVGKPVYSDRSDGEMLCPTLSVFQGLLQENFKQCARFITTTGGKVFTLKVHGRFILLAASDQNEPPSWLDSELQLVCDLLFVSAGPQNCVSLSVSGDSRQPKLKTPSFSKTARFERFVDTALALCKVYPSVLIRAVEQLDVNEAIREMCSDRLRETFASLPELRGAALFVGTRLLAQYAPGQQISPQDLLILMIHSHAVFRPATRTVDTAAQSAASPQNGATQQPNPQHAPVHVPGTGGSPPFSSSTSEPVTSPDDSLTAPQQQSLSLSSPTEVRSLSPPQQSEDVSQDQMPRSVSQPTPMGMVAAPPSTPMMSMSPSAYAGIPHTSPVHSAPRSVVQPAGQPSGRPLSGGSTRRRRVSNAQPSPLVIDGAQAHSEGGLRGTKWIPQELAASADVSVLYLTSPSGTVLPYAVYSAELLPGIFLVVVLRESTTRLPEQRNAIAHSHIALRDWLAQDFSNFLLTKEKAHMPMLWYLSQVPGVVHFIFVDRVRHMAWVPSIAALHGQESPHAHSADAIRALVGRLVQQAHSHLARGCTTMMLKSDGFHFSYRLWIEGGNGGDNDDPPPLEKAMGQRQQPWVVGPQLYADLIQYTRAARCFELYSLYLGVVPATVVAKKDRQLLQAMVEGGAVKSGLVMSL